MDQSGIRRDWVKNGREREFQAFWARIRDLGEKNLRESGISTPPWGAPMRKKKERHWREILILLWSIPALFTYSTNMLGSKTPSKMVQ